MQRAALLLSILTALGSLLGGCAGTQAPTLAPVVVTATYCARPTVPAVPLINDDMPLDAPKNLETLLTRDAHLRRYVQALRDALACYDAQAAVPPIGMGGSAGGGSPTVRNNDAQTQGFSEVTP